MKEPVSAILAEKGGRVVAIGPSSTVRAAVDRMNEERIGCLVVLEDEKPVGVFTERDVLVRVVAVGADPESITVREVMTPRPIAIRSSTTVEEAMMVVTERRCRHLPVVADGRLVGLISIGDLTRWTVRHQRHRIEDLVSYITGSY